MFSAITWCFHLLARRAPPREGVYIHGLYLEGARWDSTLGVLAEAKLKELHPAMPVIYVKARIPVGYCRWWSPFDVSFLFNRCRAWLRISWTREALTSAPSTKHNREGRAMSGTSISKQRINRPNGFWPEQPYFCSLELHKLHVEPVIIEWAYLIH